MKKNLSSRLKDNTTTKRREKKVAEGEERDQMYRGLEFGDNYESVIQLKRLPNGGDLVDPTRVLWSRSEGDFTRTSSRE